MPTISVIVPVYKVEDCLCACVDSILCQTMRDFELILVDDGSPDRCGKICDEYAEKDPRVLVIHQENQGLSGARNSGIQIARGDYITFIDSDDLITRDCLELFYKTIAAENADIVTGLSFDFPDGQLPQHFFVEESRTPKCEVYDGKDAALAHYMGDGRLSVSAATKMFSRHVIGDARFPLGRIHEDQAFVPPAYYRSGKVVYMDTSVYYYRVRQGSITHQSFSLKRYDDLWAVEQCMRFFEEQGEKEIAKAAEKKLRKLTCSSAIQARKAGLTVPKEYDVSDIQALKYLHGNVSDEKFAYYLGQVCPWMIRPYAYWLKLKKMLRTK